jgi:hypothetical protein
MIPAERGETMFGRELLIPLPLPAAEALLTRLPGRTANQAPIERDLAKVRTGWHGEQNVAFFLDGLSDPSLHIFYDLRETVFGQTFQMDVLLLTETFALIMEVKNYSGSLQFEPGNRQMLRIVGDRHEGFPNPLLQVGRQRELLAAWLRARDLPELPIESLVVIAYSTTIIDNPGGSREVSDKVIHAEQIREKLNQLQKKYARYPRCAGIERIGRRLLAEHRPPPLHLLEKYAVDPAALRRGVRCPHCRRFVMERIYAAWQCPHCGCRSRTAHIPMILDYFLLCGPTITNRQCREWLRIKDRYLAKHILQKMDLKRGGTGTGAGIYYQAPSHRWIDHYYRQTKAVTRTGEQE